MYRKGKSFGLEIYDEKRGIEFRLNGDRMHCPIENEGCYISFSVFSLATGKIQAFGRLEMEFEADVISPEEVRFYKDVVIDSLKRNGIGEK